MKAPPASPRLLGAGAFAVRPLYGLLEESVEHRPFMELAEGLGIHDTQSLFVHLYFVGKEQRQAKGALS